MQLSNFDGAVTELRRALQLAPDRASLHYDLALALKLKDDLPAAVLELKEALRLDPQLADGYYTLGVTLWQQGDLAASVEQLRNAVKVKPDYAEAYYTLGSVLKQMKQLPEAAQALREAIRLQPEFAGAHTTLASVLRQMGDKPGAEAETKTGEALAKAKTNQQGALFSLNSGKRLLKVGDLDGAISQFQRAVQLAPDSAEAHYQLAVALERSGKTGEAAMEYRMAAKLDPRFSSRPL
jgi:Flp pilus assembly protein TadD